MNIKLNSALAVSGLRFIITKGVIDMASSAVLSNEGYFENAANVALCDGLDAETKKKLEEAVGQKLAAHFEKVQDVMKSVKEDLASNQRVSEGVKEAVAKLNTDGAKAIEERAREVKEQKERTDQLEQKLTALEKGIELRGDPHQAKSIGDQFIESDEAKEYRSIGQRGAKSSSRAWVTKTIISATGSAGPGITPQYLPGVLTPNLMPLTVRDLIDVGQTETNLIIWIQEKLFTNNAGYQGSEGSLKPQSDITYEQKQIPIVTLAHWIKASKQVLADFKQLATLINNRLRYGLKLVEEREILYGDGAANHLKGLIPQATPYNMGYLSGDTKLDTIRRAMLQTTRAYYPATGIVLSPEDWTDIELTKDSQGRYMIGNPTTVAPPMLWGLPVAACFDMQRGDFLVGALKLAVTLFDREEASIQLSTEDQDNFVRNLVTILAEERVGLAVSRPAALIYGDFKAGSTG